MMGEIKQRSLSSIARDIYHIAQPFEGGPPHGKLVAIADELMHHRTPDPRVTQLVEAAREVMRAYDESSGNEPSISVLMRLIGTDFRTALKAMEQSDD